jgi:hypothetical protein
MSEPSQPTPPPVPPVPQYGEYAPAGYIPPTQAPQPGQAPTGYPMHPALTGRRRRIWDLVLTIVLLVLGFFGMLAGLGYAVLFSDPALIDQGFQQQGLGGFNGEVGSAPQVLAISHIVLYLLALGGSLPLLITKRVAFWVPLSAGVLATIIFWTTVISVVMTDPAFVARYS